MIMKRNVSLFPRKKWWKQTRLARVLLIYFYVCIVGPFLVLHPLVLLLHLKAFLHVLSWNLARVNNWTCCTMGECNCACMPVQNPFGRVGLFFCIPCFWFCWFLLFWLIYKCFSLIQTFFWLSFGLIFCVVILVLCLWLFLCFSSVPELTFS